MSFKDFVLFLMNDHEYWVYLYLFIIGLFFGGYLTVFVHRYEKISDSEEAEIVESWLQDKGIQPPSELEGYKTKLSYSTVCTCPNCNQPIKRWRLTPVIGYVLSKGKCANCHVKIPARYPILEVLVGVLFALSAMLFNNKESVELLFLGVSFTGILVFAAAIDFKLKLLPDGLNFALLVLGAVFALLGVGLFPHEDILYTAVLGALSGYFVMWFTRTLAFIVMKKEALGGGDVKLMAALGVFIGIKGVIFTFFVSAFYGLFTYAILKLIYTNNTNREVPFGPSLMLAAYTYIIMKIYNYYPQDFIVLFN